MSFRLPVPRHSGNDKHNDDRDRRRGDRGRHDRRRHGGRGGRMKKY